jgi:hypothetical protein
MPRRVIVVLAVVALAGVARAQPEEAADDGDGYIGKRRVELEVDACAAPPDNDPAALVDLASDHAQHGGVLYFQGDYEGAIREFVSAVCIDPSDTSYFYNIALSYERLLQFEKAIAYYERYILSRKGGTAADALERRSLAARVEVLKALPARIQVTTQPGGATVSFTDEFGVRRNRDKVSAEPYEVTAGEYTMTIELQGYETVERKIVAEIGQPYSYFIPLTPKRGHLVINAEPVDARIFVDDRLVGIGRYDDHLPGGNYKVTIEASGRVSESRLVEVVADRETDLPVRLPPRPASGRTQLLIGASIAGGALGSVALGVLEGDSEARAGLGFLGGVGVGFVGGYYGIPHDIDTGTSSFILTSSVVGAAEAGLVASIVEDEGFETVGPVAIAGMAGGATFAMLTADRFDLDPGDAALLNSGALWGSVTGGLFAAIFEFEPDVSQGLVLGGLNLGLVSGVLLGGQVEYSRRHVALIDLAGLAGMGIAVAVQSVIDSSVDSGDPSDPTAADDTTGERTAHFALAGMAGGLAIGAWLTRKVDVPKVKAVTPMLKTGKDATGAETTVFGLGGSF